MTVHSIAPAAISIMIATSILFVFATVAIILRFIARRRAKSIGIDDWVALSSYIFLFSVSVCHYLITGPYGYAGNPQSEFSALQLKHFLIILYADNICYTCCTVTVKLSITLFLRRVFTTRPIRIITAALTAILVVWWITVLCFQIFSCTPVVSFWEFERREHCINTEMFYGGVAISNVLFDFILLFIPIPLVWRLHMTTQRKLSVSFVFVLGGFTIICSIFRTISLGNLDVANETGSIWHTGLWTIIECGIGVICSCLPPMASLFKALSDKVRTTVKSTVRAPKVTDDIKLLDRGSINSAFRYGKSASQQNSYVEV
ncbi:hypothetical protein VSDG_08967 [Cytospora chrysosperma]|uniref:Rhodopsin domain-containing protein n=1 Tax=Cytospora chrysosperma TaxID=252740 RepID=A0A423VCU2_CYTCH|nr:hypothetical protein VSDG_08967 [Valsa sordida]